jgi:hypothetical protein
MNVPAFRTFALLTLAAGFGFGEATAATPPVREPEPLTPGGVWRAHDMKRPRPPVVTPSAASDPAPAPADATVLFDGKDLSHWTAKVDRGPDKGKTVPPPWKIENGYMEVLPNSGTLICPERFGDCQLHVEWAAPTKIEGASQGRGNSGVLIQGFCEVQVLDSYENDTYPDGQAGAIYSRYPPLVNVCRKPGEWQSYDITVQVARLGARKEVLEPARITVIHNGVLIQNAVALESTAQTFTLALQDHLNPVRFRDVWLRKTSGDAPAKEAAAKYPMPAQALDSSKMPPATTPEPQPANPRRD